VSEFTHANFLEPKPEPTPARRPISLQVNDLMRVNSLLNAVCADNQVSCCITADPMDFATLYTYESFSDSLIKIEWSDERGAPRVQYLEPRERTTIKVRPQYDRDFNSTGHNVPVVTALNNGL
jgi:hypothetical protein